MSHADVSLASATAVEERSELEIQTTRFGRITSDSNIGPRLVQLGAKFYF